jgi:hypothetical protein
VPDGHALARLVRLVAGARDGERNALTFWAACRAAKSWPDGALALVGRLRGAAPILRKIGIEIGFGREGRARTRTIRIIAASENTKAQPSAPSPSSASAPESSPANGFAVSLRTVPSDADGNTGDPPTVRGSPLKTNGATVADPADANPTLVSGSEKTGTPDWSVQL